MTQNNCRTRFLSLVFVLALLASSSAATAATITGKPLPEPAKKVLEEILTTAGVSSAEVTSVQRSARQQVEVMYDYVKRNGLQSGYNLYGKAGHRVLEVYEEHASEPRQAVVELMLAQMKVELAALVAEGDKRTQLMHVTDTHYVFDVAPSSIPAAKKAAFEAAIEAHASVSRFLKPPRDKNAFHIEIPK